MDWSVFVGLPWRDRGRSAEGYDCWGLFRAAFLAGTGIKLPGHEDDYRSAADRNETAAVLAGGLGDWIGYSDTDMQAFDGAVMTVTGRFHIGLVVRRGLMLHMPFKGTSVIEPMGRLPKATIYRHRKLT
jgi:cell wall-associated NlpC family hydrolase